MGCNTNWQEVIRFYNPFSQFLIKTSQFPDISVQSACYPSKGPFKYYVIIEMGRWVQKMAIFAYYQYIEGGLVGGSEKVQKPAYVIFEWFLNNQELKADQKLN